MSYVCNLRKFRSCGWGQLGLVWTLGKTFLCYTDHNYQSLVKKVWHCSPFSMKLCVWYFLVEFLYKFASVVQEDQTTNCYIGLASTTSKARYYIHWNSFKDEEVNQTSLILFIFSCESSSLCPHVGPSVGLSVRPSVPNEFQEVNWSNTSSLYVKSCSNIFKGVNYFKWCTNTIVQ